MKKLINKTLFFTALSCGLYLTACQKEAASPIKKQPLTNGVSIGKKDTLIVPNFFKIKKDTLIVPQLKKDTLIVPR
jgi:hypothetical protein